MADPRSVFGDLLRATRIAKGYSLRKFAELVDLSPTYVSQIEQGKLERPPTAERVRSMAELLGENTDEWIALVGRVPADLSKIIQRQPTQMPELLREATGLSAEQMRALIAQAKKLKETEEKS